MSSFLTSDTLLALAKVTAILLLAFAISPLLRHPSYRATLWSLTLLSLPFVFVLSLHFSTIRLLPTFAAKPPIEFTPNTNPTETSPLETSEIVLEKPTLPLEGINSPITAEVTPSGQNPFPWLPILFATGLSLSLIPWFVSTLKLLHLPKSPATDPPLSFWKKIHQLKNRKVPGLKFTPSPAAPFTYGLLKPRVLIPQDSTQWNDRRLQSTLLHEAAHLRRRDPLVRFLVTLTRALFWFHPLAWIAHRQLIQAQEQTCDLHALGHGIAPEEYAEDLLASVTHSHLTPTEALSMARWSQLGNRIRLILNPKKPTTMKTNILLTTLTLGLTASLATLGFAEPKNPKEAAHKEKAPEEKLISPTIDVNKVTLQEATDRNIKKLPELEIVAQDADKKRGAIVDRFNNTLATSSGTKRLYPSGPVSAHLTGYISNQGKSPTLLEKSLNDTLSKHQNVALTINSDLQLLSYRLLEKNKTPGAIVIQDPTNGEILALASYPSFDPNLFHPSITRDNFKKITSDQNKPMINRAITPTVPGSTAKLLTALAGEYAGLDNPEYHCQGFLRFGDNLKISDWNTKRDEHLRIPGALETNCNTYFMQLAVNAGENSLRQVGNLFHLNQANLPRLNQQKSRWIRPNNGAPASPAKLAMASLGQGGASLSPLELNTITAAIATGTWHQPHLVLKVKKTQPSVDLIGQGEITEDSLKLIRSGMHLCVNGERATASNASGDDYTIAGKTGTAQYVVSSSRHNLANKKEGEDVSYSSKKTTTAFFTGYAPFDNPQYAVTVFLESNHKGNEQLSGGKNAAPMASELLQKMLSR